MDTSQRRGKYFEEFGVGQRIVTAGRTVTEADVVGFAGLTGDYNQIHTDAEFARNTLYAQRVAHGLLGLSIASGLAVQTGVMEGTVLAFREVNEWKFSRPVFLGDTLHAELEVVSTKAIPLLGVGSVELRVSVNNQKDETVMAGRWTVLMQGRPSADP